MTNSRKTTLCVSIITAGLLAFAAPPAAAVTSITASSYGVSVDLSILSLIDVGLAPVAPSNAPPNSSPVVQASLTSATSLIALPLVTSGLDLSTGVITDTSNSGFPPVTFGNATSTVDGLNTNLALTALGVTTSVLSLTANTIESTSEVDGSHSLSAFGSTTIEDLVISGTAIGSTITIGGVVAANPPANDIVFGSGLSALEIILNAQTPSGDGITSDGITTDAIEIIFRGLLLDGDALTGTIVIAQSNADIFGIAAIPEPDTWAMMLCGFAGLGGMLRARRRKAAL